MKRKDAEIREREAQKQNFAVLCDFAIFAFIIAENGRKKAQEVEEVWAADRLTILRFPGPRDIMLAFFVKAKTHKRNSQKDSQRDSQS